jgi:uncharacterized protein YyaL (SSP411 family)
VPQTAKKRIVLRSCWRSAWSAQRRRVSLEDSLAASYRWLCAAQDAPGDGGVAAWYDLFHGWSASYPETTGYIIPTFLTYASVLSDPDARKRALRMADWEIDVQLPSGAVRSGMTTSKVGPAVFNTGQVMFGWTAAYQATKDNRYMEAARRAARWLIQVQDDDGAWRKHLSLMTSTKVQTYNVRSAWGLALAGKVFNEPDWIAAACRNADWALRQQRANGWFDHNTFDDGENPLLHTIGYVLEGFLGIGILLGREEYIEAAQKGVRPLVRQLQKSGKLGGRYSQGWQSSTRWRCLTGEAQIALVLLRLAKYQLSDHSSADLGRRMLESLADAQDLDTGVPQSYGALAGSHPIWGGYCPFRYLNWAAKFHMDALLLALSGADVSA